MVPDGGDGGAAVSVVDADDAAVRAARHDEVLALNGLQMERNLAGACDCEHFNKEEPYIQSHFLIHAIMLTEVLCACQVGGLRFGLELHPRRRGRVVHDLAKIEGNSM